MQTQTHKKNLTRPHKHSLAVVDGCLIYGEHGGGRKERTEIEGGGGQW